MGWFENPNHFGAWLALVAPWLWALTRWSWSRARAKSRWLWPVLAASCLADVWVLTALAGTYSRGSWVAWIIGAMVWMTCIGVRRQRGELMAMSLRVLFAAGMIFVFSAYERLDPAGWGQDRSVDNRLALWQGAAQMMADRPWTGWGAGQSGWVYCEAYQPVEREEIYRTCVNSYLTLGAEHGLWFLMILVGSAVAPLGWWWCRRHGGTQKDGHSHTRVATSVGEGAETLGWVIWKNAAVASWLAWAVANGFSTLIEVRGLWPWVAPVAVIAYAQLPWRRGVWLGLAGGALAAGLVIGVAVFRPPAVQVESGAGWWRFTANDGKIRTTTPWLVLPDERVLGPVVGREIRRLALARPELMVWLPHVAAPFVDQKRLNEMRSPVRSLPAGGGTEWARIWVLGASAVPQGVPVPRVWRLHPLGWPADGEPRVSGIILPQQAGTGELLAWRRWAETHGVTLHRSGVAGIDVRARWPQVVGSDTGLSWTAGAGAE
jgi:hypothetical protein